MLIQLNQLEKASQKHKCQTPPTRLEEIWPIHFESILAPQQPRTGCSRIVWQKIKTNLLSTSEGQAKNGKKKKVVCEQQKVAMMTSTTALMAAAASMAAWCNKNGKLFKYIIDFMPFVYCKSLDFVCLLRFEISLFFGPFFLWVLSTGYYFSAQANK